MVSRSNLENTWLPLITQKAKLLGKQYSAGEMRTIANELIKRLPQNVDTRSFNEILNKTFTDFETLKARQQSGQTVQPQQPQGTQQNPTRNEFTNQKKIQSTAPNERRFESDVKSFLSQNNINFDQSDVEDVAEEVANRYMFYAKRVGKELDDKQYQRIISDTVREKLNWEEPSEQKAEEESSADEEEVEQNAEEQSTEEEQEAQEEPKRVEKDPLTGLTVGQICKVSDNLETIIRKGLKSRFGYLMNLDYKIVRQPNARLALNYEETVQAFKESWGDSGFNDGFDDTDLKKITDNNIFVIYVLKERVISDIVNLVRENPAFRGGSGLVVSSLAVPNMAEVPYTALDVKLLDRNYNGKLLVNVGITVLGGKLRPLLMTGAGFLSDIFKTLKNSANYR
nr:MAG TPA: hypothetical protein [Caudoviricetes sp.]